jgi:predicted NUDIX family NTP pyrophosphohydrolase
MRARARARASSYIWLMARPKTSAGLLPYRVRDGRVEVLIAHMGGPFWARRDEGAWSIIKGEYDDGHEDAYAAARREFEEETGTAPPDGEPLALGEVQQRSGKRVTAWGVEADLEPSAFRSNTFAIEWPRGSGEQREFPEIDRAEWLDTDTARRKLIAEQVALLDALERRVSTRSSSRG